MRWQSRLALVFALIAQAALAGAPDTSIRPKTRPDFSAPPVVTSAVGIPHPRPRPEDLIVTATSRPATATEPRPRARPIGLAATSAGAVPADPRVRGTHPRPRPVDLAFAQQAAAQIAPTESTAQAQKAPLSAKGTVCGDPAIRGENLAPITSGTRGCGVAEPVRVTAIDGILFSQPATIDCETALATRQWIKRGMRPAFGSRKVVGLHIFGSYMCRSRNNIRGARISEHGRGKAIDIAGFIFSDGTEWTVEHDYNRQIRKAQKAACGIFGTTLGPGSDGFHEDHLHFDTAHYAYGAYCR